MPRIGAWIAFAFTAIVLCSCLSPGAGGGSSFPWPNSCLSNGNAISLRPLMNPPDCSDPLSYQYDVTRFDPDLEDSADPVRNWLVQGIETSNATISVEMEEILFSTRIAAESDPSGFAQFPQTYRYNEYRVSVRPEYGVKAVGISGQSIEEAYSKAQALCVARSPK